MKTCVVGAVTAVLALGLVSGCGGDSYCDAARDYEELSAIGTFEITDAEVEESTAALERMSELVPDEIKDDWETLMGPAMAMTDWFEENGLGAAELAELDDEAKAAIVAGEWEPALEEVDSFGPVLEGYMAAFDDPRVDEARARIAAYDARECGIDVKG